MSIFLDSVQWKLGFHFAHNAGLIVFDGLLYLPLKFQAFHRNELLKNQSLF